MVVIYAMRHVTGLLKMKKIIKRLPEEEIKPKVKVKVTDYTCWGNRPNYHKDRPTDYTKLR
jgi:hypothetical protein